MSKYNRDVWREFNRWSADVIRFLNNNNIPYDRGFNRFPVDPRDGSSYHRSTGDEQPFPYWNPTETTEEEPGEDNMPIRGSSGVGAAKYVKKGRRVTKSNPYRTSIKVENGGTVGGWNAIYVGGSTHPSEPVLRTLTQSIVRFMALKSKVDFGNWSNFCSMPLVGGSSAKIIYWYHDVPNIGVAKQLTKVEVTSGGTWLQFADSLANSFCSTFNTLTVGRKLYAIALVQDSSTTGSIIPMLTSQFYLADDLWISIKGESAIQVQNRTLADKDASLDADSIYSNPLRGKYYTFNSGKVMIRDAENTSASQNSYAFGESGSGSISFADRNGGTPILPSAGFSIFTGPVENSLQKPPPGGFFSNCATTKYMGVKPGEIVRSKIEKSYMFRLSRWIDLFSEKFQLIATKDLAGMIAQPDPPGYRIGATHIYGLEKMCDTIKAASPGYDRVQVGLEHNLYMVGHCSYRPKFGVAPLVNIRTQ